MDHGVESVCRLMEIVPYGPLCEFGVPLMGLMVVLLVEVRGSNTVRMGKALKALSFTRRKFLACFYMNYQF
jgi:hypothetical protein